MQFLNCFIEMHHNIMNGAQADGQITLDEFKAYITKDKQILEVLVNSGIAK